MFSKSAKDDTQMTAQLAAIRSAAQHADTSIIGADITVVGDIDCDGDVRIFGAVAGAVSGRVLIIEPGAQVEGSVSAARIHICGEVTGPVAATDVSIARTARVVGNITHNSLHIEPGAVLEGRRPWRPRSDLVER